MNRERREFLRAGLAAGAWAVGCAQSPLAPESRPAPLKDWIERGFAHAPVFRGALANHMPMALCSIDALGGSAAELEAFARRYSRLLEPFDTAGPAYEGDEWRAHLADASALPLHVRGFERRIARDGVEHVLRDALPVLLPGLAAGGWHALIRVAYGRRFGFPREVAHGLGYWASAWFELGRFPTGGERYEDALDAFAAARASATLGRRVSTRPGGVTSFMIDARGRDGFAELAGSLRSGPSTLEQIARGCARAFATSGDFTALHACTSTQALRVLLPFVEDRGEALRRHWHTVIAAYVGIGTPELAAEDAAAPAWNELERRALRGLNDHDLKLADALADEERAYGAGPWRTAVARRLPG